MTAADTDRTVPQMLTTEEVCQRLKIGRTKLWELRKQLEQAGRPVRPVRLGHSTLRWTESDVAALIEAFSTGGQS